MLPPTLKPERKRGSIALITAWLALLGLLAGMAVFVYLSPGDQPSGQAPPGQAQIVVGLPTDNATEESADEPADDAAAMPMPKPAPQDAGEAPKLETQEAKTQETDTPAQDTVAEPAKLEETAPEKTAPEVAATMPEPAPPPTAQQAADSAAPPPATMKTDSTAPAALPGTAPGPNEIPENPQQARLPPNLLTPPSDQPPWQYFGQPFDETTRKPRIAVVITGLGLSNAATLAAIKQLPPAVTLSFTPYTRQLEKWIALARASKHEVMIDLPMESLSYPKDDPGPQGLLTALGTGQNLERLRWALTRSAGYVGVAAVMGSRFTASKEHMEPVLGELKKRGLMFLDNGASDHGVAIELASAIGLPHALNTRSIDEKQASRLAIDARLIQIERMALENGYAVAMARPYPVSIERLTKWAGEVEARGFVLAPITALVDRKPKS